MKYLILALALVGCSSTSYAIRSPSGATCALTCTDDGRAATAGHCADSREPVVSVSADWCGATARRAAVQGEPVSVRGYAYGLASSRASTVADANWLGWVLVEGHGQPGESGGGVYGSDGALLGIVVETHDGMTWARRLP